MQEDGVIKTREAVGGEEATEYKAGDWLLTDEQGGQYPVTDSEFRKIYFADDPLPGNMYNPRPQARTFFRTDKKLLITTEWGQYEASVGDYVRVLNSGKCDCPVKPDAMQTGYDFIAELDPA